jgi:2,4-dienoyl-CoA reductase (NADPH2)
MKGEVKIPIITSNRINMPHVAEEVLARGDADLISMARPMLADPEFVNKAASGRESEINTCIACNQACLDHVFSAKVASCLVNPKAAHELELVSRKAQSPKRIAVVGAGPAGLAFATEAAERGHQVTLIDSAPEIGGQFNIAKKIPGKEEFHETIRYFSARLVRLGVKLELGVRATAESLTSGGFDEVVLATGVRPRSPTIEGITHSKVVGYLDVLTGRKPVGKSVAIIGAGGIGFDVAQFLLHAGPEASSHDSTGSGQPGLESPQALAEFLSYWGVDSALSTRGGVEGIQRQIPPPSRKLHLLQRKEGKPGAGLGKTTGWIHRAHLKDMGVEMWSGVTYRRVDDLGLHITREGKDYTLNVDNVVICAGQEPLRELEAGLKAKGITPHLIGGADVAAELDAKRAIDQGTRLALKI